jgi:mannose/fructose/N-acetylgalactosamine-specific phosphotransferase system component IIC
MQVSARIVIRVGYGSLLKALWQSLYMMFKFLGYGISGWHLFHTCISSFYFIFRMFIYQTLKKTQIIKTEECDQL